MRSRIFVVALLAACGGESTNLPEAKPVATASAAPSASVVTPAAAKVTKRVVVSLSRKSGTSVTTVEPDGTVSVSLDVLENGRGPHTDAKIKLAPDGTISELAATGHHTMGTLVDERFHRGDTHATWTSKEEHGDVEIGSRQAFFVPVCDLPDALGFLASAAIKAGGSMPLLPSGIARIEKTLSTEVASTTGEKRTIVGYAITGLDLTPTHVWMNEDGSWFAYVSPWWSVVPEGWESVIDPLVAKQTRDRPRAATKPCSTRTRTNRRPRASRSRTRACSTSSAAPGTRIRPWSSWATRSNRSGLRRPRRSRRARR